MDCIFCKIAAGEIPSKKVYEDDEILGFYDLDPQAPVHVLFIPKTHFASADELNLEYCAVVGRIFARAAEVARRLGVAEGGYRIVNNCGKDGGQTVSHLHFHLLGGRSMQWPPG